MSWRNGQRWGNTSGLLKSNRSIRCWRIGWLISTRSYRQWKSGWLRSNCDSNVWLGTCHSGRCWFVGWYSWEKSLGWYRLWVERYNTTCLEAIEDVFSLVTADSQAFLNKLGKLCLFTTWYGDSVKNPEQAVSYAALKGPNTDLSKGWSMMMV